MTSKEKALELFVRIYQSIPDFAIENNAIASSLAKQCATITVEEIELALTEYGTDSDELQNMDSEFRWWINVKQEIENI